jgi:NTE family protein
MAGMSPSEVPRRLGLALGGGVARGPAHLGVLQALHAAQVPIACVAGSSAGAIAGAFYCAGRSLPAVEAALAQISWLRLARPVWPRRGLVSFRRLEAWLTGMVGNMRFADLPVPLAVVATDMETGEAVTLREGPVARAVHASCAVPGLVEPVGWEGRWLCDGGIANNVPVNAARALGAEVVVGVDLFRPQVRRGWGALGYGAVAIEHMVRRSGGGLDSADILISPELGGMGYFSFRQSQRVVALGAQAAEAALGAIRAALAPCQ